MPKINNELHKGGMIVSSPKHIVEVLFLIFMISIVFSSCWEWSTTNEAGVVYSANVNARYSIADKQLKLDVRFLEGGENGDQRPYFLNQPISLNGTPMEKTFISGRGVVYQSEITVSIEEELEISFRDIKGNQHTIKPELTSMDAFACNADGLSQTELIRTLPKSDADFEYTWLIRDKKGGYVIWKDENDTPELEKLSSGEVVVLGTCKYNKTIPAKSGFLYRTRLEVVAEPVPCKWPGN